MKKDGIRPNFKSIRIKLFTEQEKLMISRTVKAPRIFGIP